MSTNPLLNPGPPDRLPRSRWTLATAGLIAVMAIPYTVVAVDLAFVVWGGRSLDPHAQQELSSFGLSALETANLATFSFWILAVVVVYASALAIGILRRAEWARHSAILTFTFFGLIMLPMALAGATYDPPAPNAWFGIILGLGDLAVPAMLLTRGVSDDFGDADWLRRQRELEPRPNRDRVSLASHW